MNQEIEALFGINLTDRCSPDDGASSTLPDRDYDGLEIDAAGLDTYFNRLVDAGIHMPEPETLDEQHLMPKLWEVISALAEDRVFLCNTDHLSDRELYASLWHFILHQAFEFSEEDDFECCRIDLLATGAETDTYTFLKFYADDAWREQWQRDFPRYTMPERAPLPYSRDTDLPGRW